MKPILFLFSFVCLFSVSVFAQSGMEPKQMVAQISQYQKQTIEERSTNSIELHSRELLRFAYSRPDLFTPVGYTEMDIATARKKYSAAGPYGLKDPDDSYRNMEDAFSGIVCDVTFILKPVQADIESNKSLPIVAYDRATSLLSAKAASYVNSDRRTKSMDAWKNGNIHLGEVLESGNINIPNGELHILVYVSITRFVNDYKQSVMYPMPVYVISNSIVGKCACGGEEGTRTYFNVLATNKVDQKLPITIPATAPPIEPEKKSYVQTSGREATLFTDKSIEVTIGDNSVYDHDSVFVSLFVNDTFQGSTETFELPPVLWRSFTVSPGSVVKFTAVSEGTLRSCTIGVKLESGEKFDLGTFVGEEPMVLTIQKQ